MCNMVKKVKDLLKGERAFLSAIKNRPGMFLKETSLRNFELYSQGYETAMRLAAHNEHRFSPEGFIEYSAEKYKDRIQGSYNVFGFISLIEPDDKKAFYLYFELLDEYLVSLGYEPIPEWVSGAKIDFFTGKEI